MAQQSTPSNVPAPPVAAATLTCRKAGGTGNELALIGLANGAFSWGAARGIIAI